MLKKIFLFLIKYIPIIQMVGIILSNTFCCFNLFTKLIAVFNFLIGNSTIITILFMVCSYLFKFCNWHRLIVTSNFIIILIILIDKLIRIPIKDVELLLLYYIVYMITIFIIIIIKFKCNEKVSKESIIERTKVNSRKD